MSLVPKSAEVIQLDLTPLSDHFARLDKAFNQTVMKNLKLVHEENGHLYPTHGLLILLGRYDHVRMKCSRFKGKSMDLFIDQYEIPLEAIRESLVNAVVHRDYVNDGRDIKIGVYDDLVNIVSPGAFPSTITQEDLLEGRSEARNKVIARVFKVLNFIEQWSSGIRRIKSSCLAILGLGERRSREILNKMVKSGILERIGKTINAYYRSKA